MQRELVEKRRLRQEEEVNHRTSHAKPVAIDLEQG